MRSLKDMHDYEAITIANLAIDSPLENPVVIRTVDGSIDLIIVCDNRHELLIENDCFFDYQNDLLDYVEIDQGFNVKEKHNTCCNMVAIYKYLESRGFKEDVRPDVLERMNNELYLSVLDVA